MNENELSYLIRGGIFNVYKALGPGLFESVYQQTLTYELIKAGLDIKTEVPVPVIYDNHRLDLGFRMDILCK